MSMFRQLMIANSASVQPAIEGMHFFVEIPAGGGTVVFIQYFASGGSVTYDWGDGTSETSAIHSTYHQHDYSAAGIYDVSLTGRTDRIRVSDGSCLVGFAGNLSSMGITSCEQMFMNCAALKKIAIRSAETVTKFTNFANGCPALEEVTGKLNLSAATTCASMFATCRALVRIPEIRFAAAMTNTGTMFAYCSSLVYTPKAEDYWGNPNITAYGGCFRQCTSMPNYADIPASWK